MPGRTHTHGPGPDKDPGQLKNLLLVLEHARADAWLRRDRRALEALLAPDFCEINAFGRFDRDQLLILIFPRMIIRTFTIEDPAVLPLCDGAASLTYRCDQEFVADGKKMKGAFHVSALYRWDGSHWKLTLWQISPFCSQ
jgi:hypothetical protein